MRLDPSLILLNMSVIHQAGEAARDVEEMNRDEQRCQGLSPACGLHLCSAWERLAQKPFGISRYICSSQIIILSRLQWT